MQTSSSKSARRKSLFGGALSLNPLAALTPIHDSDSPKEKAVPKTLQKRRASSFLDVSRTSSPFGSDTYSPRSPAPSASPAPSPIDTRGARIRNVPRISSWVSGRSQSVSDDPDDEPLSAVSSKAPSVNWGELHDVGLRSRNVLLHGEVQTSSTLFRKKKEYLVLTETHIVRFKSQQKASETFTELLSPLHRSASFSRRHSQNPSFGSAQDFQSFVSDHSGDRNVGTPLRQIIAVYQLVDDRPYFAFEISYIEEESNNAYSMTLQFGSPDEMRTWLKSIRVAANRVRHLDDYPISEQNIRLAARIVEREGDYDPNHFALYKVIQRPMGHSKAASSSTDDLTKVTSSVCFLAVGIHKVHLIPVFKARQRSSSPNLLSYPHEVSFGLLTLTSVRLSDSDDTFELVFRMPMQKPKTLLMASLAAGDIATRLHHVDQFLRPEWDPRPYIFLVPETVKAQINTTLTPQTVDEMSLDRTLCAYCIAYNIPPNIIRYQVTYPNEDWPHFQLLPPDNPRRPVYGPLELLAVMRALRYNETFGTISFAGIQLDVLNELYDRFGADHVCTRTKRGTPINLALEDLERSCLLVQEIRALAVTSRKVRRMDFTSCISRQPADYVDESKSKDIGCGIVEALFPLCKYQTTNVDWIVLNNIQLGETDLDYLIAAAAEKMCHFRGLEMRRCGLNERKMSLVLDALRTQENTLEAIDISGNPARLVPAIFEPQLSVFGYIRILNLCNVAHTAGPEPLVKADTLLAWRLHALNLSGTVLNDETVDAISIYLASPQSSSLRELRLDHTGLTGRQIAQLMFSMTSRPGSSRDLLMDVSQNRIETFHDEFTTAISENYAPTQLIITLVDYEEESNFAQLILAIAKNKTVRKLDITKVSLPNDASEQTCRALERMFTENDTLVSLDISGENSKLEIAKLGVGINKALCGLQHNKSLQVLHIQNQNLGLQGASTLADVLKVNTTLTEVHCENNGIPLQGFTDLVNSLHYNTTVRWLPPMIESRQETLRQTEMAVKNMRADTSHHDKSKTSSLRNKVAIKMGKHPIEKHAPQQLSEQDVQAALRLVEESWDRQAHRLGLYLQRNCNLAAGIDTPLEVEEEQFERPYERPMSMGRILEQVQIERTPTVEKDMLFEPDALSINTTNTINTARQQSHRLSHEDWAQSHQPSFDPDQAWFSSRPSSARTDGNETSERRDTLGEESGWDPVTVALAKELEVTLEDAQTLIDTDFASRLAHMSPVGSPVSPTFPPASPTTPRALPIRSGRTQQ
ncbi:hypothetical protein SLS55_003643 [Diplodia seriata]|uniref:Leucine-rich repeat-containing protein 16A n=1 Tax=Diplodia seriata TaxID=420778 RepID=A0A1S8BNP9_9PEZI|nr:Leucine-rich repeat-containing protein 16A [Diplodia seriata]